MEVQPRSTTGFGMDGGSGRMNRRDTGGSSQWDSSGHRKGGGDDVPNDQSKGRMNDRHRREENEERNQGGGHGHSTGVRGRHQRKVIEDDREDNRLTDGRGGGNVGVRREQHKAGRCQESRQREDVSDEERDLRRVGLGPQIIDRTEESQDEDVRDGHHVVRHGSRHGGGGHGSRQDEGGEQGRREDGRVRHRGRGQIDRDNVAVRNTRHGDRQSGERDGTQCCLHVGMCNAH